ncbi:MAG TPA: hypothetical protein VFV17_03500, partial [Usitatibacteraceae bacterium]|nr:hypothetical protein [Usitatibacteraceae bacterium]
QATWIGYFASTGLAEIDYFLADPVGVPEAQRAHFCETVWYLPDTRLCFTAPEPAPQAAPLPALKNGAVTFGCFQSVSKLSDATLAAWGRVLAALPQARLRLQAPSLADPQVRDRLLKSLAGHGIEAPRVRMHEAAPRQEYLRAYSEVDMVLDTMPFPGGTTTCEALWMGVPTVTLAGRTLLARQGASLLSAAGLADWVAGDIDGYVALACRHAADPPALARLRAGLRDAVAVSPLFDAPRFAGHVMDALEAMWLRQRARAGALPTPEPAGRSPGG